MRPACFIFLILGMTAILFVQQPITQAQPPPLKIGLNFHKDSLVYRCGDNVTATISVRNTSSEEIVLSNRLKSQRFVLNLRIIDPAGRLLIPKSAPKTQAHRNPPLGFTKDLHGKLVTAAPCSALEAHGTIEQTNDLNKYYNLELSGYYSGQVQLSIMQYNKRGVCNPNNYRWLGVLKSTIHYFFVDGKLPIRITPNRWSMRWMEKLPGRVMVQIPLHNGRTFVDINRKSIRLNRQEGNFELFRDIHMLKGFFSGRNCIRSIRKPEIGRAHRVWVSGLFADSSRFCGSQKILIVP